MNRRGKKQQEDKPIEEKSQLHIKDAYDYQNRSFLHIPQDVGINLKGVLNCQLTPHFHLIFCAKSWYNVLIVIATHWFEISF